LYYNKFGSEKYDPKALESKIVALMEDEDITRTAGIYEYLLDGEEKHLSIRAFSEKMRRAGYERQKGICPAYEKHFEYGEMEADHITPPGTLVEKQQQRIVKCFAKTITEENQEYKRLATFNKRHLTQRPGTIPG